VYVKEQSAPEKSYYFFAYQVTIHNRSSKTLKLIKRHWIIKDGTGRIEEVEGEGVVGQQPILEPDEHFQCTSFCPLPTPTGSMHGSYWLRDAEGEWVEAQIPEFILAEPSHFH